jgi:hypothetical protein
MGGNTAREQPKAWWASDMKEPQPWIISAMSTPDKLISAGNGLMAGNAGALNI